MTAKEYLRKIKSYRARIRRDRERLLELRASAESIGAITYDADKVQTSPSGGMPKVDELIDFQVKLETEIRDFEVKCQSVYDQINNLPDSDAADLLCDIYLYDRTWTEAAIHLNMSERNIYYKHRYALRLFGETYLKNYTGQ